jgi:circadian clock protein KaiC
VYSHPFDVRGINGASVSVVWGMAHRDYDKQATERAVVELELLPTHVTALDEILPGGLLKGGVYIIHGEPGTGKTVLANQICFNHARDHGRSLYVSLLAESHTRMLQHLRSMTFYNEAAMPRQLYYVSGTPLFATDGLKGVVELVRRELKRHDPGLLVIDGFSITREGASSQQEFLRFVHEIHSHAAAAECVVLLLTSGIDPMTDPASIMVDGIIQLHHQLFGRRTERTLRVLKYRGRDFLPGAHSYRITNAGFVIYPRVEAQFGSPSGSDDYVIARHSTGIPGIDEMLCGGLLARTTNGLYGPTGIGKTTFGLQYLSVSSEAEPGVFFGLFERPERLRTKGEAMGIDVRRLEQLGHLEILWRPQGEQILDEMGHDLLDAIRRRNAKRVFIDGFGGLAESVIEPERLTRFISTIANEVRVLGATMVVSIESRNILGANMELPSKGVSSLLEGLILMRYAEVEGRMCRLISVTKIRDSDFDPFLREFKVTAKGLEVGGTFQGFEAVLSGFGREPKLSARADPPRNDSD